jgi:hypothetical protein
MNLGLLAPGVIGGVILSDTKGRDGPYLCERLCCSLAY